MEETEIKIEIKDRRVFEMLISREPPVCDSMSKGDLHALDNFRGASDSVASRF